MRRWLDESCPGLIGHGSHEIISGLTLNERTSGRLPRWRCRVKVHTFYAGMYDSGDGGFLAAAAAAHPPAYFILTLTRQSAAIELEPGTARTADIQARRDSYDGYEDCWLVWNIEPERRRGGGDGPPDDDEGGDGDPPPGRELSLPRARQLVLLEEGGC